MGLYRARPTFVKAEQWTDPSFVPPAPKDRLRLKERGWEVRLQENLWIVVPLNGWIVTRESGDLLVLTDEVFSNQFVLVSDRTDEVQYEWSLIAHRMISVLRDHYGPSVTNANAPEKVKNLIDRLRDFNDKAMMWDMLPATCRRLGIDYSLLLESISTKLENRR